MVNDVTDSHIWAALFSSIFLSVMSVN